MLHNFRKTYNDFPRLFWIIVFTIFVDAIGGTLLFPFFSLYITQKFGVGMTQAGIFIGLSSLAGITGSMLGGALTDRFGRRKLILFGLVFSALSSLSLGLAADVNLLFLLVIFIGVLSRISQPAHDAMMADILPESRRQEGFGITRVAFNFAWIIGTALGGLLASRSFFALFVTDAIISSLVALILLFKLPETKPVHPDGHKRNESFIQTVAGYRIVMTDFAFIAFIATGIISLVVYQQQYSSFPVYLRDVHGINSQIYGIMLSISGLEVVLLQFWVSRVLRKHPPFQVMTLGTAFLMIGVALIGFVRGIPLFLLAVIVITVGEMIVIPTNRVIASNFAPVELRGRYMAIYDLGWTLPATIGPAAAGLILDHYNPNWLWYIGGLMCAVSAAWFYILHLKLGAQPRFTITLDE